MRWLLLLFVQLLFTSALFGSSATCQVQTKKHILRVMPKVKNSSQIAYLVCIASAKNGVDPQVVVAIAAQESSLRLINRTVVTSDKTGCHLHITDYGIMQINEHTVTLYGFDAARLRVDLSYQIESGVQVLADKIAVFGHWSAYHSMTPSHNAEYRAAVKRYL